MALVLALLAMVLAVTVAIAVRDDAAGDGRVISGPLDDRGLDDGSLDDRHVATLDVVDSAATITIRAADLGDRLYRAATPAGSHLRPTIMDERVVDESAGEDGRALRLHLAQRGPEGASAVEVLLHSGVRWHIRIIGGATAEVIDLREGRLSGLEIVGGVTRAEVTLPARVERSVRGGVPVRMSGGASQLVIHAPSGPPVRVRVGAGAGTVTVDGVTHAGVAAGQVFAPPGWDAAPDRYDIDATAGVGSLTVDRAGPR